MAVLSFDSGMNSTENDQTTDSSHENNLYADRQIQNKLLQVEEDSDTEAYDQKLSKSWNILKSKTGRSDPRTDINGWFPSAKFVGRRTDLQRPETKPTFIHPWKDYRSTSKKDDNYVFKHYTEYRKYIEQYRIEHGCNANRFHSGNQMGDRDMRRIAFQGSAPPQNSPITVQQMQQSGYSTISPQTLGNQSTLQYGTKKEQLGTLITGTTNGSASNKSNHIETSSHAQKYRVNNGKLPRNNTVYDLRNESDNSSDCGDVRLRSPSRRSNSASSTRTKSRNLTKSPTKITVPASSNTRSYPLQALTIQQNGKPDVCPSPKPLDNLNCVAPEKQTSCDRRVIEQPNLELALRVHSLNDLLVANEAPLRGYALPKSLPPNPNSNTNSRHTLRKIFNGPYEFVRSKTGEGSECSDTDSDDAISLGQLSTCPLSADMRIRQQEPETSDNLQKFLKEDPMLRSLNLRPEVRPTTHDRQNYNSATKWFDNDAFIIPHNDVDAMLRVNMWNPILSSVGLQQNGLQQNGVRKDRGSSGYRTVMNQSPFRNSVDEPTQQQKSAESDVVRTPFSERVDFFNPVKNVRLSITRLDNAVSFCQTTIPTHIPSMKRDISEKRSGQVSRATTASTSQSFPSRLDPTSELYNVKSKPSIYDPFQERMNKPTKFEQKFNMPLPKVKILESVPVACDDQDNMQNGQTDIQEQTTKITQKQNDEKNNITLSDHQTIGVPEISCNEKRVIQNGESFKKDKEETDKKGGPVTSKENTEKNKSDKGPTLDCLQGVRINMDKKQTKAEKALENAKHRSKKHFRKPAVANGKCLKREQELEGMTWSEKLEALRSVNKPADKPKPRQPKLKFVKADPSDTMLVWSIEHDRLYEQRRIRHLVEQARLKGGKQFDWVYEAQVKARDIDWDSVSDMDKGEIDTKTTEELTDDEAASADYKTQGKYGMYSPSKQIKQTLLSTRNLDKSNTSVTQ